jgi:hypothetical protein
MTPKPILFVFGLSLLVPMANVASAKPLECPVVSQVFAPIDATRGDISLEKFGKKISETQSDNAELQAIANSIRADFPDASNAEIANLLITAYCNYLETDAPESQHNQAALMAFEQQAYDAIFKAPKSTPETDHSWLYGN